MKAYLCTCLFLVLLAVQDDLMANEWNRAWTSEPPQAANRATGQERASQAPTSESPADQKVAWTLPQLENLAEANNPTLVQMAMRIRAAQGEYVQGGLYPNPVVGYVGEEMGDEGRAGQQGAFLSQEFVTGGKLALNRAVASHEIQRAQYAWHAQRQRVLNDVRSGYCEALAAQRAVTLNEQLVQIGQEGVNVAEQLLGAKEVGRPDVLQAQIELESARVALGTAKNRSVGAWRRLVAVVGVPDLQPAPLAGGLEDCLSELTWEATQTRLLAESPELGEARAAVERARCTVARQCAERSPNVTVESSIQYDNATDDTIASVQVGLPLPIFNRNQGNIARAQAQLVAAEREVRRVELQLQNRLAAVFEQYANARMRAEKYKGEILPKAKESLELTRKAYQQGEFGFLNLLTAQRTYFRVNLAYLDSLRELCTSNVAIEGLLLSGGLQTEAEPYRPDLPERPTAQMDPVPITP